MSEFDEKRAFQRLQLSEPIPASLDDSDAMLLDLGVSGALIEHTFPLGIESTATLKFTYEDRNIEMECEVARSNSPQPLPDGVIPFPGIEVEPRSYQSGLRFVRAIGDSDELLRQLLSEHVARILRAQQANALGERDANIIDGDATITRLGAARRTADSGFLVYRLLPSGWQKTLALLPDQPEEGFTVAAFEDEKHLEGLCRAFESADEEGRRLIRLMAELSISEAQGLPTRKP